MIPRVEPYSEEIQLCMARLEQVAAGGNTGTSDLEAGQHRLVK